jgi:hypothetical protein
MWWYWEFASKLLPSPNTSYRLNKCWVAITVVKMFKSQQEYKSRHHFKAPKITSNTESQGISLFKGISAH